MVARDMQWRWSMATNQRFDAFVGRGPGTDSLPMHRQLRDLAEATRQSLRSPSCRGISRSDRPVRLIRAHRGVAKIASSTDGVAFEVPRRRDTTDYHPEDVELVAKKVPDPPDVSHQRLPPARRPGSDPGPQPYCGSAMISWAIARAASSFT